VTLSHRVNSSQHGQILGRFNAQHSSDGLYPRNALRAIKREWREMFRPLEAEPPGRILTEQVPVPDVAPQHGCALVARLILD